MKGDGPSIPPQQVSEATDRVSFGAYMYGANTASMKPLVGFTRLQVNINNEAAEVLNAFAAGHDVSITETLRRAVAVFQFVTSELDAGNTIEVVSQSGHVRRMTLTDPQAFS